ncbi:hypothetical protein BS50DRAFT_244177 [Corynespora cassiicola Philippines]|uniref:Uncharacterized protein n=1 Tax=Corynespora cassiicola Philippines TaxID=1448308 RepID=A0A2T2P3A8_CORCC|nr:hypothetical protein BS50DRAFT_244177 [Corynespora cassiicola Philippines]
MVPTSGGGPRSWMRTRVTTMGRTRSVRCFALETGGAWGLGWAGRHWMSWADGMLCFSFLALHSLLEKMKRGRNRDFVIIDRGILLRAWYGKFCSSSMDDLLTGKTMFDLLSRLAPARREHCSGYRCATKC